MEFFGKPIQLTNLCRSEETSYKANCRKKVVYKI